MFTKAIKGQMISVVQARGSILVASSPEILTRITKVFLSSNFGKVEKSGLIPPFRLILQQTFQFAGLFLLLHKDLGKL